MGRPHQIHRCLRTTVLQTNALQTTMTWMTWDEPDDFDDFDDLDCPCALNSAEASSTSLLLLSLEPPVLLDLSEDSLLDFSEDSLLDLSELQWDDLDLEHGSSWSSATTTITITTITITALDDFTCASVQTRIGFTYRSLL